MMIKTLKDLEVETEDGDVYSTDLRIEAIRDIKKIWEYVEKGKDFRIGDFCIYCQECVSPSHVVDYIKWKFNITDEDLK